MIYILHGENTLDSYRRLTDIVKTDPDAQKVYVETNSIADLTGAYQTNDLLGTKKIIIGENFIGKQKLTSKVLQNLISENTLVLLEKKELTKTQVTGFSKVASLEIFKLPQVLFHFLDSISPTARTPVSFLTQISQKDNTLVIWHLLNRLLLLILIKLSFSKEQVSKSVGRNFAPWQWSKLEEQAAKFDTQKLKQLYFAALKVDYLVKTGKTSLPQKDLISLMLVKYLNP